MNITSKQIMMMRMPKWRERKLELVNESPKDRPETRFSFTPLRFFTLENKIAKIFSPFYPHSLS